MFEITWIYYTIQTLLMCSSYVCSVDRYTGISDDDFQCVLKLMSTDICRKHCCAVIHTPHTINALFTLSPRALFRVTSKMMLNK